MTYKTEQEEFWANIFGEEYIKRNDGLSIIASNTSLFSKIFAHTSNISSILEFGANIGLNLHAIKRLLPNSELSAIEINNNAVKKLSTIPDINVFHMSILDFIPEKTYDFVFSKTVLIHINPDELNNVYNSLYQSSSRYICIAEYYNPNPIDVVYRGHESKLFKRDFAGEMLDKFSDLRLIDYGFVYHRDNNFLQDDINWFLLEKK